MFYVYKLLDPRKNNIPFYIGKGSGDRAYRHVKETKENTINKRKFNRIQKILADELKPIVKFIIIDIENEQVAYEIETHFIKFYGRKGYDPGGILDNICLYAQPPGGQIGEKNPFFGKKHTEESRKKISQAGQGKVISQKQREQISEALKGKAKPLNFGKKLSQARTGMTYKKNPNHPKRTLSEAHKQAIGASRRGKPLSEEHRKKIGKSVTKSKIGMKYKKK